MADETGKRVSLGFEYGDTPGAPGDHWALDFAPNRARIGMSSAQVGRQNYLQGFVSVSKDKIKYPPQ